MVKKMIRLLLVTMFTLSAVACGSQSASHEGTQSNTASEQAGITNELSSQQSSGASDTESNIEVILEICTLDELEEIVLKDVKDTIELLTIEMNALAMEITTFKDYEENGERIEAFYTNVCNETFHLEIQLMEYAVAYAEFIMNSDSDFDDKYDDLDELYDVVYEDAGDEIYDEIYDGILDNMYDLFYDGLLDEAYDSVPYEKWLDACSNEYEMWLDSCSECYEIWLDTRSDVYEFWLDMRSATFGKDAEEAYEVISDFKEDIEELKK